MTQKENKALTRHMAGIQANAQHIQQLNDQLQAIQDRADDQRNLLDNVTRKLNVNESSSLRP